MSTAFLADLVVIVAKILIVFLVLSVLVIFIVWFERKVVAHMQSRLGPNRWGPFGLLTSLADGLKLFFKEPVTPITADHVTFALAPGISMLAAFLAFASIPFGTSSVRSRGWGRWAGWGSSSPTGTASTTCPRS